jgi:hypothetical protein
MDIGSRVGIRISRCILRFGCRRGRYIGWRKNRRTQQGREKRAEIHESESELYSPETPSIVAELIFPKDLVTSTRDAQSTNRALSCPTANGNSAKMHHACCEKMASGRKIRYFSEFLIRYDIGELIWDQGSTNEFESRARDG